MKTITLFTSILLPLTLALAEELPAIKLGAVYSLSSWAAVGGISELNATKMAIDEINAKGGILGRKIEISVEDNQSDLNKTVTAIQKLKSINNVQIILGPNWAEFSDVAAPICNKNKMLMLTASGYTKDLTKDKTFIFTSLPSHSLMTAPMSDYIFKIGHKKIAMATSVSAYFESNAQAIKEQLKEKGISLTSESTWNPGQADFKSYITKLKGDGYDAVILMLMEGGDLAAFLRQAKELRFAGQIYSSNAVLYDHVIEKSPALSEGIICYEYRTLAPKEFLDRYAALYGSAASHSIPRAYDNVYLLKDAIERCKTDEPEKLKDCLRASDYKGVTGRIRFTESGNVITQGQQSALYKIAGKLVEIK